MNINELAAKTRLNDGGIEACARRLTSARMAIGMSPSEAAAALDIKINHLSNMEHARQFPSREVMTWFHRLHGIDFNYLMNGDFSRLPLDVLERLSDALDEMDRRADPSAGSNPGRRKLPGEKP